MHPPRLPLLFCLPLLALVAACGGSDEVVDTAYVAGETEPSYDPLSPGDGCDALVPSYCAFPFPSDFWTVADASSPTGRRLAFTRAAMPSANTDPSPFNRADGFSPSPPILAHLPGATPTGLADPLHIGDSLLTASPTVILELDTGERVPHWAELDANTPDAAFQAFMMRPAVGLRPGGRYGVAIRHVVDAEGQALAPSPAFAALRDGLFIDDASVDARRGDYARLFDQLEAAGVDRSDLQLAWTFTVASTQDTTADMVRVRDLARDWSAAESLGFRIDRLDEAPEAFPGFAFRVEGVVTVPLFLEEARAGSLLHRGSDGLPVQNGTAEYPFWLLIPSSAAEAPAGVLQYGHGMLGSGEEVLWIDEVQAFAAEANLALLGMDWTGFSHNDTGVVIGTLASGQLHNFQAVPDGLHQAMANFIVGLRTTVGPLNQDPSLQIGGHAPLDPSRLYFYGGSQGGIYGATYMTLTPDIPRGVLGVPGQAYSLMLERSVNFEEYQAVLRPNFPGGLDLPLLIGMVQLLWDRAEPSGYTRYLHAPLPGSQSRDVLMLAAIGDHQVTTLSAHLMARTIGDAVQLGEANREIWGLETVIGAHTGSALIEVDFGETTEPIENVPATEGRDPHGRVGESLPLFQTSLEFLETGSMQSHCDGPCDPE